MDPQFFYEVSIERLFGVYKVTDFTTDSGSVAVCGNYDFDWYIDVDERDQFLQ